MKAKATLFLRIAFPVCGFQVTKENMRAVARWCGGIIVEEDNHPPFIRVPVLRPTHPRQMEAGVGSWVIVSIRNDQRMFKVYSDGRLREQFAEAFTAEGFHQQVFEPMDELDHEEIEVDEEPKNDSGACNGNCSCGGHNTPSNNVLPLTPPSSVPKPNTVKFHPRSSSAK